MPRTEPTSAPFPSEDEVAAQAYRLFAERLSTGRSTANCWYDAESELLDRAARAIDDEPSLSLSRRRRRDRRR